MQKYTVRLHRMISAWEVTEHEFEATDLEHLTQKLRLIELSDKVMPPELADFPLVQDEAELLNNPYIPGAATREYWIDDQLILHNNKFIT